MQPGRLLGRSGRTPGGIVRQTFIVLLLSILVTATIQGPLWASGQSTAELCKHAATRAAAREGVPLSVMTAIMLGESGRRHDGAVSAWPWTVNMQGTGVWFDDRSQALAYIAQHHARGARSYDVGCFQINWRWHADNFASIEQMIDPQANAIYAARFLSALYQELGDWSRAAGAYHSRTPRYANRYRARFDRLHAKHLHLDNQSPGTAAIGQALSASESAVFRVRATGSLFAVGNQRRGSLFARSARPLVARR